MRKLIYILFFLTLVITGCNNQYAPSDKSISNNAEVELNMDKASYRINSFEKLSSLKLREYFDLLKLQKEHPEFNDIQKQLQRYASEDLIYASFSKDFKIENIQQVGAVYKISDSLNKLKLKFDLVSKDTLIKGAVFVNISSKTIDLDGNKVITNKVRFTKE